MLVRQWIAAAVFLRTTNGRPYKVTVSLRRFRGLSWAPTPTDARENVICAGFAPILREDDILSYKYP